jgi:hypothetical protein
VGIPTSRDPDTPEELKNQLFVRIHKVPAELPHSTQLELEKLRRIRTDSDGAFVLELLRGLLRSREILQPSEPHLSLYSKKNELGSTIGS